MHMKTQYYYKVAPPILIHVKPPDPARAGKWDKAVDVCLHAG